MIDVRIQAADFDPGRQLRRIEEFGGAAAVSFTALVDGAGLVEARVEHYPALARNALAAAGAEAAARWPLSAIILIHRHGSLAPGARLAFAAVASPDPAAALAACAFLAEALRTRAPFWRKDIAADGTGRWR
jgi:molybdopterin synthase catalytic subunit